MIDEPVVVIRDGAPTGEKDRYGKPIIGPDVETTYRRCRVSPATSSEPLEVGRSAVLTALRVSMPPGAVVLAGDRLRVRGEVVEVDGDPGVWRRGVEVRTKQKAG